MFCIVAKQTFHGRCKSFWKWIKSKSLSLIELHLWLFTQRYWIWLLKKKNQYENFANLKKLEVKNSPVNIVSVHIFTNIYFFSHPYSYFTVWIMKICYGVTAHITHFRFLPISPLIFATVQKFALDYLRDQQILTPPCEWGWVVVVPLLGKTLEVEDSPGMVWAPLLLQTRDWLWWTEDRMQREDLCFPRGAPELLQLASADPQQPPVQDWLHQPLHEVLWMVLRLHDLAHPPTQCSRKLHPD